MTPAAETTEKAFRALVRTHGLFRQEMEAYFHTHALSGAQWGVLRTLHRAEAEGLPGLAPGELGRRMIVKAPSVTGVIDRLERQGFVERTPSPTDLRSKQVRLTRAGRSLVEGILKHHPKQMEKILGVFSATERQTFLKLISKLETHLDALVAHDASPLKK